MIPILLLMIKIFIQIGTERHLKSFFQVLKLIFLIFFFCQIVSRKQSYQQCPTTKCFELAESVVSSVVANISITLLAVMSNGSEI